MLRSNRDITCLACERLIYLEIGGVRIESDTLVDIQNLTKYFELRSGIVRKKTRHVHAVDGISFSIKRGETTGLVGESGSGKTTAGLTILRLIEPTSGAVFFEGKDVFKMKKKELIRMRHSMQMVFQDPFTSLNPRLTLYNIDGEGLDVHKHLEKNEKRKRVIEILETVGLSKRHLDRYPHEFSGGQRQRIAIGRALAVQPKFLVADEPVAALDISIRSQVLQLLQDLKKELELTILFISHDLSVVKYFSDHVAVMYVGKVVELASTRELFLNPQHPYTEALLSAVPIPDPTIHRKRIVLKGDVPTPIDPPPGCRFQGRCPYAEPVCSQKDPQLINTGKAEEHFVACHLKK